MNKIKAFGAFLFSVGLLPLLADEAIIDTTTATTAITTMKTELTSWVTSALPIVLGVAGAFLAFWLVKFAIRIIKQFVGTAK